MAELLAEIRTIKLKLLRYHGMKYVKHSTTITLHKTRRSDSIFIIYRITCQGKRLNLHSGISIDDEKQWDGRRIKHGVKVKGTSYNILNGMINQQEAFIDKYFEDCAALNQCPNLEDLKDRFGHAFKNKGLEPAVEGVAPEDEFSYLMDQYIEAKAKERSWADSMIQKHQRLKKRILKVKKDIRLTDFSESMMNKLMDEFATTMYNDAIDIQISMIKRFIRWAQSKHYPINEECLAFSPKLPKVKKMVRYLTVKELDTLRNLDLSKSPALDRTRDLFLFQCGTALRYEDLRQLTHKNVIIDEDGNYFLTKLTEKDDDVVNFPLCSIAKEIYFKYKDKKYPNGQLFPVISNDKYNKQLKAIGKKAKLEGVWVDYEYRLNKKIEVRVDKDDLASHTARRTFVVTALNEGISPELIALVTSHSDLKAMKPYIKINPKGTKAVVDAFDKATTEKDDNKASETKKKASTKAGGRDSH